jgi:MFS family permease
LVPRSRVGGGAALILVMMIAFTVGNAFFGLMQAALSELVPASRRGALLGIVTAIASTAGPFGAWMTCPVGAGHERYAFRTREIGRVRGRPVAA